MEERGLVHIYHGDGKGKTTAAVGLALRAVSAGRRVLFVQFFKNGLSGEIKQLKKIEGITVLAGTTSGRFFWDMDDQEKAATKVLHNSHLVKAAELITAGQVDFLILDELLSAWNQDMLDRDKVLEIIDRRTGNLEICMTGRDPDRLLLDRADYITNMKLERHPFEQGIAARRGIEF